LVEIIKSNQNFDFDGRNRDSDKQSKWNFWRISVENALNFYICIEILYRCRNSDVGIEIPIQKSKSESEFRCRQRNRNRNSDFDNEISTKSVWNFAGVSISSKVNNQNRNRNRNSDFNIEGEISENRNFDEIRIKFRRNYLSHI
jgi:hypothetical protein